MVEKDVVFFPIHSANRAGRARTMELNAKRVLIGGGIIALGIMTAGYFLTRHTVPDVDVVHGVPAVSNSMASIAEVQQVLADLPPAQRTEYLKLHWPNLGTDVTHYVREHGAIPEDAVVTKVDFVFGSLKNVVAYKGGGGTQEGYFKNQVVALLYLQGESKPHAFIVECTNGMVALPSDFYAEMQPVGTSVPQMVFTIGRHEGLIHHVDFPLAIDLAERCDLPLYRGRKMGTSHRISPAEARSLQSDTDRVQVTVKVFAGDRFDLNTMTCKQRKA